jgi:tetratricopeptide (TPR) repeat protein
LGSRWDFGIRRPEKTEKTECDRPVHGSGPLNRVNESLHIRPDDPEKLTNRGFVYLKLGQLGDAISDFSATLKTSPKYAKALYGRGLANLKGGDVSSADADVSAAKAIQPDIAQALARDGVQ